MSALAAVPIRSLPDVWAAPARGLPWCDCGQDHQLTEDDATWCAEDLLGSLPERLTHAQVIATFVEVWKLESVCRFFTLRVEDAALEVNGAVADDYPLPIGLGIVKAFCDSWCGCPDEACNRKE